MAKGGSTSSSATTIPRELKPLYAQTGQETMALQKANPVSNYLGENPTQIAPLSGTQNKSLDYLNRNLDTAMNTGLGDSDIAKAGQKYFQESIAPGITNQATLSGLGRSTANTNALAAAEAQTMLPLFQGEQARRDALIGEGFKGGDIERSVEQQGYNAEQADYQRRQALAEQALFGVSGQLPSTFGKSSSTSGGGGLFKSLIPFLLPIASFYLALCGL